MLFWKAASSKATSWQTKCKDVDMIKYIAIIRIIHRRYGKRGLFKNAAILHEKMRVSTIA